jgi:hypothetical protein
MSHFKHNQKGISIIEVIVTMFMLAVILVFYVSALNLVALTKKLKREDYAYHIANKQMEALRNTPYANLPVSGTINDTMFSNLSSGSGSFTVTSYPSMMGLKEAVVTVTWVDTINKSIELRTVIGNSVINP